MSDAVFADALRRLQKNDETLTCLNLSNQPIREAQLVDLVAALNDNKHITRLILPGCKIDHTGAAALGECLKTNTSLTLLVLDNNKIGDSGAAGLGEGLKTNTSLTELYLHNNTIGDDGAAGLGEGLKTNTSLTKLNLTSNHIGDIGAAGLGEGLKTNTRLTLLDLEGNHIGDTGAARLGEGLKTNTILTKLDLSLNHIGDPGAAVLLSPDVLPETLTILNLAANHITTLPASFHHLFTRNPSLRLSLGSSNPIYPPPSLWPTSPMSGPYESPTRLVAFFRDLAASTAKALARSRIMLIGEGGVGKTTLAAALKLRGLNCESSLAIFHAALKKNFAALSEPELRSWIVDDVLHDQPHATERWAALKSKVPFELTGKLFLALKPADILAALDVPPASATILSATHALLSSDSLSLSPSAPYAFLLHIPHVWTAGVDFSLWEATPGTTLSIFDYAGQMEFFPAHQLFLWSRQAVHTIVFDARCGLRHTIARVQRWLELLAQSRRHGDRSPATVVLVATHTDVAIGRGPTWSADDSHDLIATLNKTNGDLIDIRGCFCTRYYEPDGGDVDKLRDCLLTIAAQRDEKYAVPSSYMDVAKAIVDESRKLDLWPVVKSDDLTALGVPPDNEAMLLALSDLAYLKRAGSSDSFVLDPMMWLARILGALLHPKRGLMTILDKDSRDLPTLTGRDAMAIINAGCGAKVSAEHEQDILPLLARFDLCFSLRDGVSFVVPSALPKPTPSELKRFAVSEDSTIAARRFRLADDCRLLPPALELAILRSISSFTESAGELKLLRSGFLAFSINVHLRGLIWFSGDGNLRTLDVVALASKSSGAIESTPQYLLDILCTALAIELRSFQGSVSLIKLALMPAAVCVGADSWRPPFDHVLLGGVAQMPVTTTIHADIATETDNISKAAIELIRKPRLEHAVPLPPLSRPAGWYWDEFKNGTPEQVIVSFPTTLLTDDRVVVESWPGKDHQPPRPPSPAPAPPPQEAIRHADLDLFTISTTLALDKEQQTDLAIAFEEFWDCYADALRSSLGSSKPLRDAFAASSLADPTFKIVGSTAETTGVLFADWDILVVLNGDSDSTSPLSVDHLEELRSDLRVSRAIHNELRKALKTALYTLQQDDSILEHFDITYHTDTVICCKSVTFPLAEFDLVPVFAVAGNSFVKATTLEKTNNTRAARRFTARAKHYNKLPEFARMLKLLLKRGLNLPLHNEHKIKVPSCVMTKVLIMVVNDRSVTAKWWNDREGPDAPTFQARFNKCLEVLKDHVVGGKPLPSDTTGSDTLWMYDPESMTLLRHFEWRLHGDVTDDPESGKPNISGEARAMAADIAPKLRAEMEHALALVLQLNAVELLDLFQTARRNLKSGTDV